MSKSGLAARVRLLISHVPGPWGWESLPGKWQQPRQLQPHTGARAAGRSLCAELPERPGHGEGVSLPFSSLGLPQHQPKWRVAAPTAPSAQHRGLLVQRAGEAGHTARGSPGVSGPWAPAGRHAPPSLHPLDATGQEIG